QLGPLEVVGAEDGAGVVEGVRLQTEPLLEPGLQVGLFRIDLAGHDADGRPAVDTLEPLEDGPQKLLPALVAAHVVNGEDDDGLDALLADPLRRDQLREAAGGIIEVGAVEVGKAVTIGGAAEKW